jgi:tetratricopeptide (TPR) repeat protein
MADDQDAPGDAVEGDGSPETHQLGPPGGGSPSTDLDPETAGEYRQAARAALRDGETDLALDRLDRAVELAERAGDDELAAGALVDRGNARMERVDEDPGDPRAEPDATEVREAVEAAVAEYTAAVDHDPDNGEAYFNRGLARARLGDRAASTADLERAVELNERHADAFLVRANSYAEAGADEAAREDFTRAIDDTDAARAYFNRGNANRRLGDHDAAVRDYRAALDRAGDLPDDGLRVLTELAGSLEGEAAVRSRTRAALLAVARREIWRGVDLATPVVAEGPVADDARADAGALVLAGDALHDAAGYGREGPAAAEGVDIDAVRGALVDAELPPATAALVRVATADGGAAEDTQALRERAPASLGRAVAERDDEGLRAAATVEFLRQLRVYDR